MKLYLLLVDAALYVLSTETIPLLASNFVLDSMQDMKVRSRHMFENR